MAVYKAAAAQWSAAADLSVDAAVLSEAVMALATEAVTPSFLAKLQGGDKVVLLG